MARVSRCLRSVTGGYAHWCPGCGEMHVIAVTVPFLNGAKWEFDGNLEQPTFSPSVNIFHAWSKVDPGTPDERCHYFLKAGQIQFLMDCTHDLKGQTVPAPELPAGLTDG